MNPKLRPLSVALLAASLMGATLAMAADPKPPKSDIPPPPAIDDPGVSTPANAPSAPQAANDDTSDPLAPLPKPDSRLVRDKASRDAAATNARVADSQVTRRKQGDDTVEEYRQKGHLWMVRIVQPNGPTQTFYDNDGSGRLARDPREGPVSPVYYTLYEWK